MHRQLNEEARQLDPVDEPPIQEILTVLDLDHQCTRLVEAWNHDLVAQIRHCGQGRIAESGADHVICVMQSMPVRRSMD